MLTTDESLVQNARHNASVSTTVGAKGHNSSISRQQFSNELPSTSAPQLANVLASGSIYEEVDGENRLPTKDSLYEAEGEPSFDQQSREEALNGSVERPKQGQAPMFLAEQSLD